MGNKVIRVWSRNGKEYVDVLYIGNADGPNGSDLTYSLSTVTDIEDSDLVGLTDAQLRASPIKTAIDEVVVSVTPVLTVHANYASGDYIGTSGAAMQFANMVKANGGSGLFRVKVYSNVAQAIAVEVWLFDSAITPPADSAAWSISDADNLHCIGVISCPIWFQSALNSNSFPLDSLFLKCASGTKDIWACVVSRGAPTFADGDLTVKLLCVQD